MLIKLAKIILCLQFSLLFGCAFNPIKPTEDLNMHYVNVNAYEFNKSFNGIFCADDAFFRLYEDESSPPIRIAILKDYKKSKLSYYENIVGGIILYDPNSQINIFDKKFFSDYPLYEKQCGIGKEYPYIYSFKFSLQIQDDSDDKYFKEQKEIINQLKTKKYLDVVLIRSPFMSISRPILISENPIRLNFTNEQIHQILNNYNQSTEPSVHGNQLQVVS